MFEFEKSLTDMQTKIAELKKEHLEKILNDPNLSIEAQEQLKIRNHPSFFKGMKAFKNAIDHGVAFEFDNHHLYIHLEDLLKDECALSILKDVVLSPIFS